MPLRFIDGCYVGDKATDVADFLRQWDADGYPVHEVQHRACGPKQYIADSEDYWDEEQVYISVCACEEEDFNIAVGFSLYQGTDAGSRSLATNETMPRVRQDR